MGYRIRIKGVKAGATKGLSKNWGQGSMGDGEPYKTKERAIARLKKLVREYTKKKGWETTLVRTRDNY
jgi:hypothetical protein